MINILAKFFVNRVRQDYDAIAQSFSETREREWPGFALLKKYFNKKKDVLDIGCGNGRIADFFEYKSYTGIDISKNLIEIAKKRATQNATPRKAGCDKDAKQTTNNVQFKVGNFTDLPSSKKFDLIISIAVFHHLPSGSLRVKALKEVKKIMKNKGLLIFSVWNLYQDRYKKQRMAALLRSILTFGIFHPRDLFIPWKKGLQKRERYYYAFKENEVVALLRKTDFKLVDIIRESNGKRVEIQNAHNIYFICRENRKTPR